MAKTECDQESESHRPVEDQRVDHSEDSVFEEVFIPAAEEVSRDLLVARSGDDEVDVRWSPRVARTEPEQLAALSHKTAPQREPRNGGCAGKRPKTLL